MNTLTKFEESFSEAKRDSFSQYLKGEYELIGGKSPIEFGPDLRFAPWMVGIVPLTSQTEETF